MGKEDWQKPYVQRVLDYHNLKYGRGLALEGRCEDIHPELQGQRAWDWSATDGNTSREAAIEVKRLTCPELQENFSVLYEMRC